MSDCVQKKRIVVLDVETTGKDRGTDQILELGLRFGLGPDAESRAWRMRPLVKIHPEALAVHGITLEAVADCPPFGTVASEFLPLIEAVDVLIGYNVAFDLDILQAELARAGRPPLNLTGKLVIDALRLWHRLEPRTLAAAHAKFCGAPLNDAHQASADVAATARVLSSMLATFGLTDKPWSEIAELSDPFATRTAWLGPSAHIQWDESGAVVFGFGKNKGQQVEQADAGFLKWILAKDFPPHVKQICEASLSHRSRFNDWISSRYARPVANPSAQDALFEQDSSNVQGTLL